MSYQYNGEQIHIAHPVTFVSVNKNKVIFTDRNGIKRPNFSNPKDARSFVHWLKRHAFAA